MKAGVDKGTRRVRHEVADGVALMLFSPYSLRSWGNLHLGTSIALAVVVALILGLL
jgi:hypothetical protein